MLRRIDKVYEYSRFPSTKPGNRDLIYIDTTTFCLANRDESGAGLFVMMKNSNVKQILVRVRFYCSDELVDCTLDDAKRDACMAANVIGYDRSPKHDVAHHMAFVSF